MLEELRGAMRYRHLLVQLTRRNILARYKRSFLGVAWTMLNPLGMMVVMTVVFSTVFGRDPGYPAYLLSGLIVWQFFSQSSTNTMRGMVWGGSLLKQVYIPRTVFAISAVSTAIVNLLLTLIPLSILMVIVAVPLRWTVVFLPISLLSLTMFSLGFGLLLSVGAVYFPDLSEMFAVLMRAWMYLTPIIYPISILPEQVQQFVVFNPMYLQVKLFRIPVYEGRIPTAIELWPPLLISIVTLLLGWWVFSKRADEFAYRI